MSQNTYNESMKEMFSSKEISIHKIFHEIGSILTNSISKFFPMRDTLWHPIFGFNFNAHLGLSGIQFFAELHFYVWTSSGRNFMFQTVLDILYDSIK